MRQVNTETAAVKVNYLSVPESGVIDDATTILSTTTALDVGDYLSFANYLDGVSDRYSFHSFNWGKGKEGNQEGGATDDLRAPHPIRQMGGED